MHVPKEEPSLRGVMVVLLRFFIRTAEWLLFWTTSTSSGTHQESSSTLQPNLFRRRQSCFQSFDHPMFVNCVNRWIIWFHINIKYGKAKQHNTTEKCYKFARECCQRTSSNVYCYRRKCNKVTLANVSHTHFFLSTYYCIVPLSIGFPCKLVYQTLIICFESIHQYCFYSTRFRYHFQVFSNRMFEK